MDEAYIHALKERAHQMIYTPAEKAMVVEQCEAAKVALDSVIAACKGGDDAGITMKQIEVVRPVERVGMLVHTKVHESFIKTMLEGEE